MSYGRDPYSVFRRALVGTKRGCEFIFNYGDRADFEQTLLWRHSDTMAVALQRSHAIPVDADAGAAQRHAMLPEFEGLDRWIHRPEREALIQGVDTGALTIERLELTDARIRSKIAQEHVQDRWTPDSPLRRAACAVVGYC